MYCMQLLVKTFHIFKSLILCFEQNFVFCQSLQPQTILDVKHFEQKNNPLETECRGDNTSKHRQDSVTAILVQEDYPTTKQWQKESQEDYPASAEIHSRSAIIL